MLVSRFLLDLQEASRVSQGDLGSEDDLYVADNGAGLASLRFAEPELGTIADPVGGEVPSIVIEESEWATSDRAAQLSGDEEAGGA